MLAKHNNKESNSDIIGHNRVPLILLNLCTAARRLGDLRVPKIPTNGNKISAVEKYFGKTVKKFINHKQLCRHQCSKQIFSLHLITSKLRRHIHSLNHCIFAHILKNNTSMLLLYHLILIHKKKLKDA